MRTTQRTAIARDSRGDFQRGLADQCSKNRGAPNDPTAVRTGRCLKLPRPISPNALASNFSAAMQVKPFSGTSRDTSPCTIRTYRTLKKCSTNATAPEFSRFSSNYLPAAQNGATFAQPPRVASPAFPLPPRSVRAKRRLLHKKTGTLTRERGTYSGNRRVKPRRREATPNKSPCAHALSQAPQSLLKHLAQKSRSKRTLPRRRRRGRRFDDFHQLAQIERLRKITFHPRRQAALAIAHHRVRRQRDDRRPRQAGQRADRRRGPKPSIPGICRSMRISRKSRVPRDRLPSARRRRSSPDARVCPAREPPALGSSAYPRPSST